MATYEVGEVCEAYNLNAKAWHPCTIKSELGAGPTKRHSAGHWIDVSGSWPPATDHPAGFYHAALSNLRKLKPSREDLQITTWQSCPWQPSEITV